MSNQENVTDFECNLCGVCTAQLTISYTSIQTVGVHLEMSLFLKEDNIKLIGNTLYTLLMW